ncbi:FecCD family ABC transporter permease [Desulfobacula toluolica]|uniref:Predicted iron ABC transporter, permease protein n=1 Tax=Desulfobacula toluolica (strain DSM 7467 / Tol2) TaxID=651182 RepID=K0NE68_DESTT|nr:iron ABC transporter permease [Desulfobacula toluolica]CCK79120.1 predicted iron ABC transporter, permease protein [Desulfobacula toluolica Tol2]
MKTFSSSRQVIYLLIFVLTAAFAVSAISGRVTIKICDLTAIFSNLYNGRDSVGDLIPKELVFLWIRLPRCIMAVLVGSSLAVSGAVYQALFRNPLVSPDILGVSAGCTFGAALGLILPFDSFSLVHILSFGFGILAVSMSVGLAKVISIKPMIVLVLAGMVVLSFFNALLMAIKYFSDPYDELPSIVFWVMGSLSRVTWDTILVMAPFTLAGLILFIVLSFRLNILSLGDVQAKSLGMNPSFFRIILITASSFMVAVSVATCGQISWIGLVIPHMARSFVGPEHEKMIPVTALMGGLFLLIADSAARSVSSAEIPVGILTALTGAPIFGYFMFKNRSTGWL